MSLFAYPDTRLLIILVYLQYNFLAIEIIWKRFVL